MGLEWMQDLGPDPSALGQIADGARLQGLLPYLEQYINKLQDQLDQRVFALVRQGKLSGEVAQMAWQQKLAYNMILKHFQQQIRIGVSAATKVESALRISEAPYNG